MQSYSPIKLNKVTPLHDHIIVADMAFSERMTFGGIILRDDNMKTEGVRPRWGRVYAVGPDQKEIKVGQWIMVSHGRWTRGVDIEDASGEVFTIRRVDNKDIIGVADELLHDDSIGDPSPV
jgi:co-chaperonin GroES (HSP10)